MILDTSSGKPSKSAVLAQSERQRQQGRRKKVEEQLAAEEEPESKAKPPPKESQSGSGNVAVRVVDGKVVIDQSSLSYDQMDHSLLQSKRVIQEDSDTRHWSRKGQKRAKWTAELTEQFYLALRKYGTDFTTISHTFPDMTRAHIVSKFKKEEKLNPDVVQQMLDNPLQGDEADFDAILTEQKPK